MYEEDLALDNLQCLICNKTKPYHKSIRYPWFNV